MEELSEHKRGPIETGVEIIKSHIKNLPQTPGVYRMLDAQDNALYVGKAKALKNRVMAYTKPHILPVRLQRMIAMTRKMEFIHTHTEEEALLLEANLIKTLKPHYNILLRDDKSFAYILITGDHEFPLVTKYRGKKSKDGEYYGPYPSAGDVNRTLTLLQRVFLVRNCSDSVFANRTRPCLQYHIKRCTAPCVGLVTKEEYAEQITQARDFLNGKSDEIQKRIRQKMQAASADEDYETAAKYRDRLKSLASIRAHQDINLDGLQKETDVIALSRDAGISCIQVFFFRNGRNNGNRSYFISHGSEDTDPEIISAFITQFYLNKPPPKDILVNYTPEDKIVIEDALSQEAEKRIKIINPSRGKKLKIIDFAHKNADTALKQHIAKRSSQEKLLNGVKELFDLEKMPERIEVYDNSHISGTHMTGAMIVAGPEGFQKNAYRKFNIKTAADADDYAMMREVLSRRFKNFSKDKTDVTSTEWPDIVLIDGGIGQYNAVKDILKNMGVFEHTKLVAIAKGEDRHAGRETFHVEDKPPFQLPKNDPVLYYLQQLRDESHRFVIGAHRTRRNKNIGQSPIDQIPGIGPKRKKALLAYFGSGKAVTNAGIEDLQKAEGISKNIADAIYNYFHQ